MKVKLLKGAGAGVATLMLFYLFQDMRVELNELRERIVALETIIGERP